MSDEGKLILLILSLNISFSLAQFVLEKIKDRTETDLDNRLYNFVVKMNEVLRWISASRK